MPLPTMLLTTRAVSVQRPIARTNPADLLFSTYPQGREPAGILLYSGGLGVAQNAVYRSTSGRMRDRKSIGDFFTTPQTEQFQNDQALKNAVKTHPSKPKPLSTPT